MSKNTLLEKFKKIGFSKEQSVLEDSFIFKEGDEIVTDIPVVNIAFSGQVDGGFSSGVHIISGESKSFKSALGLNCVAAYLKKYEDAICIFYDSEFGSPIEYFKANNVDLTRVLHVPITNIEELLFDITKKIEEIEKDDHIIILIDSLGNLASKKEVTDALEEKSAEDMTRAKKMKSLFRQITPKLVLKNVPLIAIQHVYKEIGMFTRFVVSGGSGSVYSANTIFIVTKSQEKEGTELAGWNFTINIEKSRKVREKSKLSFRVRYDDGIEKYSGLLELAIELGFISTAKRGYYMLADPATGEIIDEKSYRKKEIDKPEFWNRMLENPDFKNAIEKRFKLTIGEQPTKEEDEDEQETGTDNE